MTVANVPYYSLHRDWQAPKNYKELAYKYLSSYLPNNPPCDDASFVQKACGFLTDWHLHIEIYGDQWFGVDVHLEVYNEDEESEEEWETIFVARAESGYVLDALAKQVVFWWHCAQFTKNDYHRKYFPL